MRITLRWGRSRDYQPVAFHGRGGVCAVRIGGLRHHATQLDDGAGEIRVVLLRAVCRGSFSGGIGDGAAWTVDKQFPVVNSQWMASSHCFRGTVPLKIGCNGLMPSTAS